MTTETRVYTAWSPFWRRIGSKPVTPSIVYKSVTDGFLPLFATRKACQRWIDEDSGTAKKAFGLVPRRTQVTISYPAAATVGARSNEQ